MPPRVFFAKISEPMVKHTEKRSTFHFRQLGFGAFIEREKNEEVVAVFRRPFSFALCKAVFRISVFWLGAGVVWFFYPDSLKYVWQLLLLFGLFRGFSALCFWYFNGLLMTSENLILIQWPQLFLRKSTRLDYWNLDEIEVERVGLAAFSWNFGDLHFQKINEGELFTFKKANRPNRAARIIESFREQMVDSKNFTEESALKNLLSNMVQTHVGEHGQPERGNENKMPESQIDTEIQPKKSIKIDVSPAKNEVIKMKKIGEKPKKKKAQMQIIVEKELDDEGGLELDLSEKKA